MAFPLAPHLRAALLVGTLAALGAASLAEAQNNLPAPHGYPRLAYYGSIRGTGYPFIKPDSTLDTEILDQVSRYDEITLDVNPIWPYRPDVISALRQRNPRAKFLAYVVGQNIWEARDRDSLRHYPTRYRRLVDNNDGWLYSKQTGGKYYAGNVNLAKRDASGNLVIADSLALLWKDVAIDSGVWDGIFYDILCDEMSWPQGHGDSIDFVRAGYATFEEFNASWTAATDTIASRMRRWGGDDFIMVGNCALGTKYSSFNGWMREGFPYQAGGDWYSNMFQEPGGYMTDERSFRAPRHNYIFSFPVGEDPYWPLNTRIARFGLGSAALGDGFAVFGGQDRDAFHSDYHNWWYDEYAVDMNGGGVSSESGQHVGWLGQALTDLYQMIWVGTNPDAVTNPSFEQNTTGWGLSSQTGSRLVRDTNCEAPVGACAGRVDITTPSPIDWYTTLWTTAPFQITPWNNHSVTFWAKATTPRSFSIVMARADNGQLIQSRKVVIGTEWKQYQLPLNPYGFDGMASLQFYLGKDAGSVWFDDVHFQMGTTTAYRRDFQNGIVIVNPSNDAWVQVPLDRDYKRIVGVRDPITNDGTVVSVAELQPQDALFLVGDDVHAPATIRDLRVRPFSP